MPDPTLEELKAGIRRFQKTIYPAQAENYQRVMSEPQRPHTLIITCADSRIHPDVLTQAAPGEIFVTRNIGNIVPAYGEMLGGVSAVLEFAVSALQVRHIVICGHLECGAMKGLVDPDSLETMPTVKAWLQNAQLALNKANEVYATRQARGQDPGDLMKILTEQNVLLQMKHVRTHPSVADAIKHGELSISGWVYDIAHGQVSICEDGKRTFEPMT